MSARPGEAEGLELLALSRELDQLTVPRGPNAEAFQVMVTFAVRARRLVRAIFALLDQRLDLEAMMLDRVLMETTVTLQWLAIDFPGRIPGWRLDDARRRLDWDDAHAKAHEGERLMSAAGRRKIEALAERLTGVGASTVPSFRARCAAMDPRWHSAIYTRASHAAVHPSVMAIQPFIERIDAAGAHVRFDGPDTYPDDAPHEWASLWLYLTLDVLSRVAPSTFPWEPELRAISARIEAGIGARGPTS